MEDEQPRHGKSRRGCIIACVVAPALALIPVLALVGFRVHWSRRVRAELDALRRDGYPVTLEELNAWYPEPEGENAAPIYQQAFDAYVEYEQEDEDSLPIEGSPAAQLPPAGEPLPKDMRDAVARYIDSNRKALDLLHQAAAIPECRYPLDLTTIDMWMPPLVEQRQGARLLALETAHHTEWGRTDDAIRSVDAAFALAQSSAGQSHLITHLVRLLCNNTALESLERTLCEAALSDEQSSSLTERIAHAEDTDALRRAFAGEACFLTLVYRSIKTARDPDIREAGRILGALGWVDISHVASLEIMRQMIKACELSPAQRLKAMRALDVHGQREQMMFAQIPVSALDKSCEADTKVLANLGAARTALAVERYRLATGALPTELSALVPEYLESVPVDPFGGEPLRYTKRGKGYVVYSVGLDARDDGGVDSDDVTFVVERQEDETSDADKPNE